MTNITLTDFIIQNPWISFGLAWPIGGTIAYIAWVVANLLEDLLNFIANIYNMTCNTFVITVRGYVPQVANDEKPTNKEDK